jgi:hypothetical protein
MTPAQQALAEAAALESARIARWVELNEAASTEAIEALCAEMEARKHIPVEVRRFVYERDEHRCVTCGSTERLSLDHIIPWSLGGADDPVNLQTMCRPCNSRKGARV